jgi:hypothetical protein
MIEKVFPVFRKNTTGTSVFKILSMNEMIEKQRFGSLRTEYIIQGSNYNNRLLISDAFLCASSFYTSITKSEFEEF